MNKNILLIAAAGAAYYLWSKKAAAPVAVMSTIEPNPSQTLDNVAKNAATVAPAPFSPAATAIQTAGTGSLYVGNPAATQSTWQTGGLEPQTASQANAPTVDRAAVFKAQGLVESPWAPGNYVTAAEAGGYQNALAIRAKNDAELAASGLFH